MFLHFLVVGDTTVTLISMMQCGFKVREKDTDTFVECSQNLIIPRHSCKGLCLISTFTLKSATCSGEHSEKIT